MTDTLRPFLEQLRCNFHLGLLTRAESFKQFISSAQFADSDDDGLAAIVKMSGRTSISEYLGCAYNSGIITQDEVEMLLESFPEVAAFNPQYDSPLEALIERMTKQLNGEQVELCKPMASILNLFETTGDTFAASLSAALSEQESLNSGSSSSSSVNASQSVDAFLRQGYI